MAKVDPKALAAVGDAISLAILAERERCAKIAADFRAYTGWGSENENTLIGMFARGNRNASACIAAAIRNK